MIYVKPIEHSWSGMLQLPKKKLNRFFFLFIVRKGLLNENNFGFTKGFYP